MGTEGDTAQKRFPAEKSGGTSSLNVNDTLLNIFKVLFQLISTKLLRSFTFPPFEICSPTPTYITPQFTLSAPQGLNS